jgi:thymidylate synthase (FAD)
VQAARVSYGKGTKKVQEDRGLIRYLMRHRHTTPFEMCEIKLHVRAPMDVWRQWIRHRSASVNEYSTRYSIAIDAAQGTPPDQWRLQSGGNRQGSAGLIDAGVGEELSREEAGLHREARRITEAHLEGSRANRRAKTFRSPPTRRPTGRSTSTICSTSWRCAWTTTRSSRFASTRA